MIIKDIITPVVAMGGLGIIFGACIAVALKVFGIELDESVMKILSMLPGINCGACGRAGCAAFAEALSHGEAEPSACVVSSEEARKSLAKLLGLELQQRVKTVATLLCNGGSRAVDKYNYNGIESCKAASLVFGGYKACNFGCLGFGDCVDACPFGAITIGADSLPVVDDDKCTACGKCLKACPKNLFVLLPAQAQYYVKCSSTDPGGVTAKSCKSGCIGCRKCEKSCPAGAVKIESNLARIDAGKCQNTGKCFEVCPTKVIVKRG